MVRRYEWVIGGGVAALSVLWAPSAFAAGPVTAMTQQELHAHHIEVTNWSHLVAYVAYHAVASGHVGTIGKNVRRFWSEVGQGNPGLQSLSEKERELGLLIATARLAATRVSVVNRRGEPVRWHRYMEKPHRYYYFAIAKPDGHVLSTVVVPWTDPKPAKVRTIPVAPGRKRRHRSSPPRGGTGPLFLVSWGVRLTRY